MKRLISRKCAYCNEKIKWWQPRVSKLYAKNILNLRYYWHIKCSKVKKGEVK